MAQHAKERWNEVGERFASLGRRLSDQYQDTGSGESAADAQRTLKEAARQIGNELDRAFRALDDTLSDRDAKQDLKDAIGAIGRAVSATIDETAAAIKRRGGSSQEEEPSERPDEGDAPATTE